MINIVKETLTKKFKLFWRQESERKISDGKLDTFFSFKTVFREPYLDLQHFQLRKATCKLRISTHNLLIEYLIHMQGRIEFLKFVYERH